MGAFIFISSQTPVQSDSHSGYKEKNTHIERGQGDAARRNINSFLKD
jgi:hypothetical protein